MHSAIESIISGWFEKHKEEKECFFDLKTIKMELKKYYKLNSFKIDWTDKDVKLSMKKDFNKERGTLLTRPDSLEFKETVGNLPGEFPDRRSQRG